MAFNHLSRGSKLQFAVLHSEGVQIVNYRNSHWICTSTIDCLPGHVKVYDSLYPSPSLSAVRQVCNLAKPCQSEVVIAMMDVQTHLGGSDCRLFAIAFAVAFCNMAQVLVTELTCMQDLMRSNLSSCFQNQTLYCFPSKPRPALKEPRTIQRFPFLCVPHAGRLERMTRCMSCQE